MIARALAVWLVLMLGEIVHGTLRELYLKPVLGDFGARQVSVFSGSLLLFGLTCQFFPWLGTKDRKTLLQIGFFWVALTIAFEVSAGRWLAGRAWSEIASDFAFWRGGLLPAGLIVLACAPNLAARVRG